MNRWKSFETRYGNSAAQRGHEIWSAVVIDRLNRVALWVRYTTLTPHVRTGGVPVAIVWASFFDVDHPENHCFAAETYELEHAHFGKSTVRFPRALFSPTKLDGLVQTKQGELSWDLKLLHRFEPREHVPWGFGRRLFKSHSVCCSPFADVTGLVVANGRELQLSGARGSLTHIWGRKRVEQLYWALVPAFDNDLDETAVEVLAVKPGPLTPMMSFATLVYQGKLFQQASLWQALRGESHAEYPFLRLQPRLQGCELQLSGALSPEQTSHFLYKDADGGESYVSHCDAADMNCFVKRGGQQRELNARGGASIEFHGPRPWADVEYLNPFGF